MLVTVLECTIQPKDGSNYRNLMFTTKMPMAFPGLEVISFDGAYSVPVQVVYFSLCNSSQVARLKNVIVYNKEEADDWVDNMLDQGWAERA